MSKIGKTPINIPQGVSVTVKDNTVNVTGPKGNFVHKFPMGITVVVIENEVKVGQVGSEKEKYESKALWGLTRALLANMVKGVSSGFEKKLELSGVGYRAQSSGSELTLSLGFSHPVKFNAPTGITFRVDGNFIIIEGADKALIGDLAAKIRSVRKPEPYKGKGIKYFGERIRRKAGKAAKAVGGAPGAK